MKDAKRWTPDPIGDQVVEHPPDAEQDPPSLQLSDEEATALSAALWLALLVAKYPPCPLLARVCIPPSDELRKIGPDVIFALLQKLTSHILDLPPEEL